MLQERSSPAACQQRTVVETADVASQWNIDDFRHQCKTVECPEGSSADGNNVFAVPFEKVIDSLSSLSSPLPSSKSVDVETFSSDEYENVVTLTAATSNSTDKHIVGILKSSSSGSCHSKHVRFQLPEDEVSNRSR
jgi:hypothetical protein